MENLCLEVKTTPKIKYATMSKQHHGKNMPIILYIPRCQNNIKKYAQMS